MLDECLRVFFDASVDESAYTEFVIANAPETFAIEAVVGWGGADVHKAILEHWGLNANQLPLLSFGPGLKENGKCADQRDCPLFV